MPSRPTLHELGIKHNTDKAWHHNYCYRYEAVLAGMRDKPVTVLELGIGGGDNPESGGESLRMWADYFTNGIIIGLDLYEKTALNLPERVTVYKGSQEDQLVLSTIHANHGDFDAVIDDASHLSSLTIKSFELLWPKLKSGGIYAVEDTHGAYHSFFYGDTEANLDPDAILPSPTMMQFLRRLADDANFDPSQDSEESLYPQRYWRGYAVDSVTFSYNLCIIRKR